MSTYVIISNEESTLIDFNQVEEGSLHTLRFSLDKSKTFVKFAGEVPASLEGKLQHTHSEILEILKGEEWTEE